MTERPHGHRRYKTDKCRCATCRYDQSRYRVDYKAGRGPAVVDFMPADKVRAHLRALSAQGVGVRRIAALTGLEERTVRNWKRGQVRTARSSLAALVLAVKPDDVPARFADATGTQRRIRGLVALGWPVLELATRLGMDSGNVMRFLRKPGLDPRSAEKVAALYDELSMVVPAESTSVVRARRRAVRDMWFKPLAWDDERIGDPDALPCLLPPVEPVDRDLELLIQHVVAGHPVEPTFAAAKEIVRRMPGVKPAEIAPIVGRPAKWVADLRARMKAAAC